MDPDKDLEEFINEYLEEEKEWEKRIRECRNAYQKLEAKYGVKIEPSAFTSEIDKNYEVAKARNKKLLKDLQKSKAILRTASLYSPSMDELRDLAAAYRKYLIQK